MSIIQQGTVLKSEVNQQRYVVHGSLGGGGFGDAYEVSRLDERDQESSTTCLKISPDADIWHGEAFFGGLLRGDAHAVQMVDAFPAFVGSGRAERLRFCIEMELVPGGTVLDACFDGRLPWPPDRVQRQIRLLLGPLTKLHRMGTSHRDITPSNVFIGNRSMLKLGDFGLAKVGLKQSGVIADAFHIDYIPRGLGTWWSPADDVFQVGLLALTLLAGEPVTNTVRLPEVSQLAAKGPFRDAIKKAIKVKAQRFPDASTMAAALSR